jgi:hypothetical protein
LSCLFAEPALVDLGEEEFISDEEDAIETDDESASEISDTACNVAWPEEEEVEGREEDDDDEEDRALRAENLAVPKRACVSSEARASILDMPP